MIPWNIPNILTIMRIGMLPFMVLMFYIPFPGNHIACSLLFLFASFTDWLDGYLARRFSWTSPFGEFLDPVADKLAVVTALLLFVEQHASIFYTIPAMIIISREITISALREWMAEIGHKTHVNVSFIGKVKTVFQMMALVLLLAYKPDKAHWLLTSGTILLYCAVALTLWSMAVYIKAAWPDLTLPSKQE